MSQFASALPTTCVMVRDDITGRGQRDCPPLLGFDGVLGLAGDGFAAGGAAGRDEVTAPDPVVELGMPVFDAVFRFMP